MTSKKLNTAATASTSFRYRAIPATETVYEYQDINMNTEVRLVAIKREHSNNIKIKLKDKAVPLQAWSGPEGSRKLRYPDFMTSAQDGGKVVSLTHRPPLPPGNTHGTHFC